MKSRRLARDVMRIGLMLLAVSVAACGGGSRNRTADERRTVQVPPTRGADSATRTADTAKKPTPRRRADSVVTRGAPDGYVLRTDDPQAGVTAVQYTKVSNRLDVVTGPAHILYAPDDTLRAPYIVATTFRPGKPPTHPEAFGLFIGGSDLEGVAQRYTYFVVRGTGEFLLRVREGTETRDVVPWTAHPMVPKQSPTDKSVYRLAIQVSTDSVRLLVNGTRVRTVAREAVTTDGVFGLRINHNLQVSADVVRRTNP